MTGSESELSLLRQEVAHLNDNALRMNREVGTLAGALESVAQLQVEQSAIKATAATAYDRVEQVAAASATKTDLAELSVQRRRAVRNLYVAFAFGALGVLGIGVGGIAAATAYNNQQTVFRHAQYTNCVTRNGQTAAAQRLYTTLLDVELHNPDQQVAAPLIQALREAQAKAQQADCANLLKR